MTEFDYVAAVRHLVNAEHFLLRFPDIAELMPAQKDHYSRCKRRVEEHPVRLPRKNELELILAIIDEKLDHASDISPLCMSCRHFEDDKRALEFGKAYVAQHWPALEEQVRDADRIERFCDALPHDVLATWTDAWRHSQSVVCQKVGLKVNEPVLYLCHHYEDSNPRMTVALAQRHAFTVEKELRAWQTLHDQYQQELGKLCSSPARRTE